MVSEVAEDSPAADQDIKAGDAGQAIAKVEAIRGMRAGSASEAIPAWR